MKRDSTLVKKFVPCPLWDFAGLQNWLNEQAQKGYALERWPLRFFIGRALFRKDPAAAQSRYCLDPIGERIGELELRERAANYREFGWHYVDRIGKLYAVYRCDDPEAQDLYTDPESLAWAMKKQLRWTLASMIFWVVWFVFLFRNEWPLWFRWPEEFLMNLIFRAEILIPLYGILLILALQAVSNGIGTFLGIRRTRACLSRGEWPTSKSRRYPEFMGFLLSAITVSMLVLFLVYLGISGVLHSKTLSGPEEWNFPHVTLEETLPAGVNLRTYSDKEILHSDTFDHSLLAPEQYDVAQGGMVILEDGTRMDSRLYQESIRAASPALAQAIYRGRVTAHRHALEEYRINWEENASIFHTNSPNAYDFTREEELAYPGLDALTRFVYRFSDETHPNVVYIGLAGDRVFVLNCDGAVNGDTALTLLVQRLAAVGT